VVEVRDDEVIINEVNEIDGVGLLGEDLSPVFGFGAVDVDGDDLAPWGVEVGVEIKDRIVVANEVVASVGFVEEPDKRGRGIYGAVVDAVFDVGAAIYVEDEEFSVVGY